MSALGSGHRGVKACPHGSERELLSTEPDIGVLYDLAPSHHLLVDETAELLRRGRTDLDVELLETGDDIRVAQYCVYSAVELLNDRRRSAVRHEDTIPLVGFEARQRVGHGWNIRQAVELAFSGMRNRFYLAALDQP